MQTEEDINEKFESVPNVTLIKSNYCSMYDNLCKKKKKREYEDYELRNVWIHLIMEYKLIVFTVLFFFFNRITYLLIKLILNIV